MWKLWCVPVHVYNALQCLCAKSLPPIMIFELQINGLLHDQFWSTCRTFFMRHINVEICCPNWCVLQVEKGLQLLTQVNDTIGQQPSQSKTVCLANGTVKRCWSLFLSLPMERYPEGGQRSEDYSLDHAIEAYRNHVSVVYFLLGKEHWAVDNKGTSSTRSGQF